jgi:ketosteroid isomerase-like protein
VGRVAALAIALAIAAGARADTGAGDLAPEVRALVDAWLAAQNRGDFAAYDKLYATRFTGVRRSGTRSVSLDRKGWMADRARMFAKPMKVSASDLAVAATPASARVTLMQEWESGSYHDRGPKQLVVVREAGQAKIAREEMLGSARAPAGATMAAAEKLALVVGGYAILDDRADESWAAGAPRLDDEGDPVVTSKRASKLPPELTRWIGRTMTVQSPGAAACTATVRELRIVSLVIPHFGTREDWKENHRSAREKADDAWSMSAQMVGARLEGCKPKSPAFARATELPPLALVMPEKIAKPTPAMLAALRALPSWKALQKSYVAEHGKGRWDRNGTDATIEVVRWALPTPLVTISAHAFDGCAGFGGEIFAVFDAATMTLVSEPQALRPAAALMLDGEPAFFGIQSWSDFGTGLQLVPIKSAPRKIDVPYLDCPC